MPCGSCGGRGASTSRVRRDTKYDVVTADGASTRFDDYEAARSYQRTHGGTLRSQVVKTVVPPG